MHKSSLKIENTKEGIIVSNKMYALIGKLTVFVIYLGGSVFWLIQVAKLALRLNLTLTSTLLALFGATIICAVVIYDLVDGFPSGQ